MKQYDIYISYSRKDLEEVKRFVAMLKARIPELSYWFDLDEIIVSDDFEEKIIDHIIH